MTMNEILILILISPFILLAAFAFLLAVGFVVIKILWLFVWIVFTISVFLVIAGIAAVIMTIFGLV